MSLINKEILPFTANAYDPKKDEFIEVSEETLKGSWNVLVFYPADFSFVCPTELEDVQNQYDELQKLGVN
ncbi:MAG: redoxin domain-containing protein, partial [Staphylococcus simulans]|nr:redoxin domain-containing protein [Staphylococcus simulans]